MANTEKDSTHVDVRKGQPSRQLDKAVFIDRFRRRFFDPGFDSAETELARLAEIAWDAYDHSRKAPRTRKAGPGYADPDYDLSVEWLAARAAIEQAAVRWRDPTGRARILAICGSPRSDQTCPGEMSKTYRLMGLAREIVETAGMEFDLLDLSHLTSEYGRVIYPCKACVSTAMPLCHWPCSCYPNHALGQVNDWMNEIYPRWVAAHGIFIATPVHWNQAPSVLKLMIDRLVCADGGNSDPTSTRGKDPAKAKRIELDGWNYPRHLAGRAFAIVVHADAEGAQNVRHALTDWLTSMHLIEAGAASIDRYVGYYDAYATSHQALDRDLGFQEEVRNAARALVRQVEMMRKGRTEPDAALDEPRKK
ncbi:MAG TPA: flavodoxin family protein [Dongiaceae bacterium]|nr:flavodoxin family protein [Dongiaceae bacterium]